jgi:GTP cyclohydrolase FolE2
VDSQLWGALIAGAVGVIALFAQASQNRKALAAAAEQNRLTLEAAREASSRSEVWARFHWAMEQASTSTDHRMREAAWVVLRSLAADPSATAADRAMMGQVMLRLAQLGSGPGGSGSGSGGGQQ